MKQVQTLLLVSTGLMLAGCVARGESSSSPPVSVTAGVERVAYRPGAACGQSFLERALDHVTKPRVGDGTVYDSNGSGVAVADLNGDGLQDIVLGNLDGPAHVFWNRGDFRFTSSTLTDPLGLEEGGNRAVQIVDANADGQLDIAFTHTRGGVSLWLGDGQGRFRSQPLETVSTPAYTMLWDDLDGDGDVDLVTASYDAMLERESKDFLFSNGGGVVVYTNENGKLVPRRIKGASQALAIALFDVNADGRRDLIVGNDFAVPDDVWLNTEGGWVKAVPFKRITKNTMGFAVGDTDNDGSLELYATDMKPDFSDRKTLAAWMPFMQKTFETLKYSGVQRAENVLQKRAAGGFENAAYELRLDATGWSWSAQFGDLDNNGFQDLYVVNGMIDTENLKYLPGNELVEKNRAFGNTGGQFALRPDWKLDSISSGRGMTMADLNNDGRLDIVVNNLAKPAQVFENALCGGPSLEVELAQPGTQNTRGLGSSLKLIATVGGREIALWREVVSQSGYLSGSSPRVHFGLPADAIPKRLEITWPDGSVSSLDTPTANAILTVRRVPRRNP